MTNGGLHKSRWLSASECGEPVTRVSCKAFNVAGPGRRTTGSEPADTRRHIGASNVDATRRSTVIKAAELTPVYLGLQGGVRPYRRYRTNQSPRGVAVYNDLGSGSCRVGMIL